MAHFHQQQATRVDEYGNPIPGGHGILGQTGATGIGGDTQATRVDEYGNPIPGGHGVIGHIGTGIGGRHHDADAGGYGRQAGYGATGTGVHDAGGVGGYGPTGAGPNAATAGHGLTGTGTGLGSAGHTGAGMHGTHGAGGLGTGVLGGMATHGTHGTDPTGLHGATGTTGIHGPGHTGGMHGATTGLGTGIAATHGAEHKTSGILRRSGSSSSSSSSEDDGMGGRRKKGIKDKIKEKLPGGHKDQAAATGGYAPADSAYTGTGTGTYGHDQGTGEKKGMMDKIKEKLPGGGHRDEYGQQHATTTATGGYGPGRTGTTDTYGTTAQGAHEKKGIMEKIKEKLPGTH